MAVSENMDWVIAPQHPENSDFFYGCRAITHQLFIASGCCAAVMVPRKGNYNAECSRCHREFPISAFDNHPGEKEPFRIDWGQFTWDDVDEQIYTWVDFYFNLKVGGEVKIFFNSKTSAEFTATEEW